MNTFDGMGVPPLIGRATMPSDAAEDAEPVTLLGYRFWQREFGGDPGVLGRKLLLNGKLRTVIGVMPSRFMWRGADVYLPDVFHRGQDVEGVHEVDLLARLAPGVTRLRAQAAERPVIADLVQRNPDDFPKNWRVELRTFKETFPSGITDALWILFGAVGLLLLIACVNVSNLLLSVPPPPPGNRHPRFVGRQPSPAHQPIAGRKPGAGRGRRRARRVGGLRRPARHHRHDAAQHHPG